MLGVDSVEERRVGERVGVIGGGRQTGGDAEIGATCFLSDLLYLFAKSVRILQTLSFDRFNTILLLQDR